MNNDEFKGLIENISGISTELTKFEGDANLFLEKIKSMDKTYLEK